MCLGSFWTALQLLWSSIYIFCGATQIISGIFFLISIPTLNFTPTLVAGFVNVVMGAAGGAVVCFGKLSPRRQEALLYIAFTVLAVNLTAAILREWGLFFKDITELLKDHPQHLLILYGCFATRIVAIAIIIASFLDSQFAFCSMQIGTRKRTAPRKKKTEKSSHENLPDIEYIIPKQKPSKSPSKPHAIYNAYAQSWVFEVDQTEGSNNLASCTKSLKNGSPKKIEYQQNGLHTDHNHSSITNHSDSVPHVDNPIVYIEEASDDSTSTSERKIGNMKSFSRTASPIPLSASSSQSSLNLSKSNKPPIYDYLEKLTEPEVYRSRLNSALSDKEENESVSRRSGVTLRECSSPRSEKVQYASFMQELQRAIVSKKETVSPQSTSESISVSEKTQTNSKSSSRRGSSKSDAKSSDGDFSRKLEAALQLIQDLESPNTIETPSDAKSLGEFKEMPTAIWRNSNASSEDSDKTQTGLGSMGELTSPLTDRQPELLTFRPSPTGKGASIIVHCPNSQSTSGYSSPSHPPSSASTPTQHWSTTSSINGSNTEIIQPVSYSIHNSKCTTVISLFTPNGANQKGKSVTLVSITGDNDPVTSLVPSETLQRPTSFDTDTPVGTGVLSRSESTTTNRQYGSNGWKSLLRKKKQAPKLCPELEGAIIKSESLAYLSDVELLARHQRNNEMHRKIEERVIQQLGVPRTESKC